MINLVGQIDTYERGLMSDEEMVDFFQTLQHLIILFFCTVFKWSLLVGMIAEWQN